MSPFWEGFFSVFGAGLFPRKPIKHTKIKPFEWYHKGPWWEHPFYKGYDKDR